MEFWEWADSETTDGRLPGVTLEQLCEIVLDTTLDFWLAVVEAGWLQVDGNALIVPNFDRWMGKSAKKRLENTERQRTSRKSKTVEAEPVALLSRKKCDKSATTEQNRREEDSLPPTPLPQNQTDPTSRVLPCDHPELIPVARAVVEFYQNETKVPHAIRGAPAVVLPLLLQGHSDERLRTAVCNYAAACRRNGTEPRYRLSAKSFFEEEVFAHFEAQPDPGADPEDDSGYLATQELLREMREQDRKVHEEWKSSGIKPGQSPFDFVSSLKIVGKNGTVQAG